MKVPLLLLLYKHFNLQDLKLDVYKAKNILVLKKRVISLQRIPNHHFSQWKSMSSSFFYQTPEKQDFQKENLVQRMAMVDYYK